MCKPNFGQRNVIVQTVPFIVSIHLLKTHCCLQYVLPHFRVIKADQHTLMFVNKKLSLHHICYWHTLSASLTLTVRKQMPLSTFIGHLIICYLRKIPLGMYISGLDNTTCLKSTSFTTIRSKVVSRYKVAHELWFVKDSEYGFTFAKQNFFEN